MGSPSDVRAKCAQCGPVELSAELVSLIRFTDLGTISYAFNCPHCHAQQIKPADEYIAGLLRTAGVIPIHWRTPAELDEKHDGLPVSYDDLLDLMLQLSRESTGISLEA